MDKGESSGSTGEKDVYNGKGDIIVLTSLLDLYSELEVISVSVSMLDLQILNLSFF